MTEEQVDNTRGTYDEKKFLRAQDEIKSLGERRTKEVERVRNLLIDLIKDDLRDLTRLEAGTAADSFIRNLIPIRAILKDTNLGAPSRW